MRAKKDNIYSIFRGPTRDELFDSMKYQYDENANVGVEFLFGSAFPLYFTEGQDYSESIVKTKNIRINSISHMNISGHKFVIRGTMDARILPFSSYELHPFNIIYDTKERTGSIRLKKLT